jgi:hypothetical protein
MQIAHTTHATRARLVASLPPMTEDSTWRAIPAPERPLQTCEGAPACDDSPRWITRQGNVCACDYHRFVLEVLRAVQQVERERSVLHAIYRIAA